MKYLSCYLKLLILIFFINFINCYISIKYYNEPLPNDYIANSYNNCTQSFNFLAISNDSSIIISDLSIIGISNSLLLDPFGVTILNVKLLTFSNTTSPITTFIISITDNNLNKFNFTKTTYCLTQEITEFSLNFKNLKLYSNEIISKDSKIGIINSPKMVVEFIGNTPSIFKSFNTNSSYETTVKLLGQKTNSKLYEISIYPVMPSYYYSTTTLTYNNKNNVNNTLSITSSFEPFIIGIESSDPFYPSLYSRNSIIKLNYFYLSVDLFTQTLLTCQDCYAFQVSSIGTKRGFAIYMNKYGTFAPRAIISKDSNNNYAFVYQSMTISPLNISNGEEMNLVFQDLAFATTPLGFSAILTGVTGLPNTPVTIYYPCGLQRMIWFNQYPFGLQSGYQINSINQFNLSFTVKLSKYSYGSFGYSFNSVNQKSPILLSLPTPSTVDTKPPVVIDAKIIGNDVGRMKIVIRMIIQDDLSGFSAFVCLDTNEIIFDYKDLDFGGTIYNGTYSFVYDFGFKPICKRSAFLDFAGNALIQEQPFTEFIKSINPSTGAPNYLITNVPSYYQVKTLSDFDQFYFAHNNINLTDQGFYNTLYFKFKNNNNDPNYGIKFTLAISSGWSNPIDYYSTWDNNLQMYKVEFYLPPNLSKMNILYYIYLGHDSETQYSTSHFQSWVDPINATLSVYSVIGDMMPPLVKAIQIYSSQAQSAITFSLVIKDDYSGFDYGQISIRGSVDYVSWNFTFSSENKNPLFDTYNFTILQDFNYCTSQYYVIDHLKLFDKNGIFSEFTFGKQQVFPIIDPMVNVEFNGLTAQCPNLLSNYLPKLTDFSFTPLSIDVGGPDSSRSVLFTIVIEGLARIGTKPTIYLGDTFANYVSVPVLNDGIFDSVTNTTKFIVSTIIPYGFGYPEGILLNVYGIQSPYNTFNGYSSLNLRDSIVTYTLLTHQFTIYPKMTSYYPISSNGGELTIFGRQLSTIANSFYTIKYSANSGIPTQSNIKVSQISYTVIKLNVSSTTDPFTVEYATSTSIIDSIIVYPYIDYWNQKTTPTPTPTLPPTNPPQKCGGNPQCGGELKGKCVDGVGCVCIPPYIGSICESRIITIPPPLINPNNPNQNLTLESTGTNEFTLVSLVSLISLRELNFKNELVRSFRFDKWQLISNTSINSNYITDILDPNDNNTKICSVNVSTIWYESLTDIEFAGQKLTMNPSTLKYNINITSFPFTNKLNTLQLVMSATAKSTSSNQNTCTSNEFGETTSNDNSNYLQLSVNDHSLYGRFIKRGIVDNSIISIENEILTDLSSENSYYISQSYIGINIPFYYDLIQLDPDFSVLLDQSSASSICKSKSSKLSKGAIIGISIGCAAFTIIIVTLLALFLKNKYFFKTMELKVIKLVSKKK